MLTCQSFYQRGTMKRISEIMNKGGIDGLERPAQKPVDRLEQDRETARKLLLFGVEIDIVMKVTKLSYGEVCSVKRQVQQQAVSK